MEIAFYLVLRNVTNNVFVGKSDAGFYVQLTTTMLSVVISDNGSYVAHGQRKVCNRSSERALKVQDTVTSIQTVNGRTN